jgi:hypothetical protein
MKFKYGFGPGLICLLTISMFCCIMTCLAFQPVNEAITRDKPSYEENFSTSKNSFFGSYSDDISSNYFENGKYHIEIFQMNSSSAYFARTMPTNFTLEVEATQVSGPDDNGYGVILESENLKNYYYFLISSDGYYRIARFINTIWLVESMNNWNKSDAILTGNATNLINIICNKGNFSFYVNDQYVGGFNDDYSDAKMIGLIAETENTPGTVIIGFDNLKVWGDFSAIDE